MTIKNFEAKVQRPTHLICQGDFTGEFETNFFRIVSPEDPNQVTKIEQIGDWKFIDTTGMPHIRAHNSILLPNQAFVIHLTVENLQTRESRVIVLSGKNFNNSPDINNFG